MNFDTVRWFVASLDKSALQFFRERGEVNEFVTAGSRISTESGGLWMLPRIRRVERMKRCCEDWMTGDMVAPIVESDALRVCAVVRAKARQALSPRFKSEPAAVLLSDRAVRSFYLRVMKN